MRSASQLPAGSGWSDAAVRDTIDAIVSASEYRRALGQSILDRVLRWIVSRIGDFLSMVEGVPYGRTLAIGLLLLVVAVVVARVLIGVNAERQLRSNRAPRRAVAGATAQLADADRLAALGDYTAAAHALFTALLATFATRGLVRVHASKTTGDYARELRRRHAESVRPFQSFRSRYDRVIYGDMQCSAGDYTALAGDARELLRSNGMVS